MARELAGCRAAASSSGASCSSEKPLLEASPAPCSASPAACMAQCT